MEKIKFNKDNYSGNESEVRIYRNGSFVISSLEGYTFWLVENKGELEIHGAEFNPNGELEIHGSEFNPNCVLGIVSRSSYNPNCNYLASGMEIDRSDKNRFVAAAKLLCNIV